MTTATFDTLQAARKLKAAGLEEAQAEAIASQLREASTSGMDHLATKAFVLQVAIGIVFANVSLTVALLKLL